MLDPRIDAMIAQASRFHQQGRLQDAIELFQRALAAEPDVPEAWYELGYALKAAGRFQDALDAYDRALASRIRAPEEVHLNRGVIFSDHLRRDDDAERELQAALAIAPQYLPALLNLGNLHEERGRRDEALACYDAALAAPPGADRADDDYRHEALARSVKLRAPASLDDPQFAALHAASAAAVSRRVRANVLYALGHAYERLGCFEQAFDALAKANRWLAREPGRAYDHAGTARFFDSLIDAFSTRVDAAGAQARHEGEPLFVCGMFRSGSTLIEQVLAAHPRIEAGGELDHLRRLAFAHLAPFPASVATEDPARDRALADDYLRRLAELFPDQTGVRYITDKRPDNFVLIGLIKRLFPHAKIVHTVRNPLDTGLSIFTQHLNLEVTAYAADLGDIGHYYGQYRRLMRHWTALYPDSIFEFDYDAFVREPRAALERLFSFLDLPFDDRCLSFHDAGGTVKTASYWQVRQPLHAGASGRWRNYAERLRPLRQALQDAGVEID